MGAALGSTGSPKVRERTEEPTVPPSDPERLALYEKMTELLGSDRADTLMESLSPVSWDQMATKADLAAMAAEMNGRFAKIDGQFATLDGRFAEIDGRFTAIEGRFAKIDGRFDELRGEMRAMEGRMERRIASQTYVILFSTMAMVAAAASSIWAAILLNPLG